MVELLVVVVLGSLVLLAALQILISNERTYSAQNAAINGQESTRIAMDVLFDELREVSSRGGDILGMSSDSIRVRHMRKFRIVCDTSYLVQPILTVVDTLGGLTPAVGDSVYIFADGNERITSDDTWILAQITAVASSLTCTDGTTAGMALTFAGQGATFAANKVGLGAPVRSFGYYTFADTTYQGDSYLARREDSGRMIPLAGPLRATGGLEFAYQDSLGAVTTNPLDVRQIVVTVRTGSGVMNSVGGEVEDSLTASIYTRN